MCYIRLTAVWLCGLFCSTCFHMKRLLLYTELPAVKTLWLSISNGKERLTTSLRTTMICIEWWICKIQETFRMVGSLVFGPIPSLDHPHGWPQTPGIGLRYPFSTFGGRCRKAMQFGVWGDQGDRRPSLPSETEDRGFQSMLLLKRVRRAIFRVSTVTSSAALVVRMCLVKSWSSEGRPYVDRDSVHWVCDSSVCWR